jgi:uncharacterized SAM-binding protein YcdF (DUF218 family)
LFFILSKTMDVALSPLTWTFLLLLAAWRQHRRRRARANGARATYAEKARGVSPRHLVGAATVVLFVGASPWTSRFCYRSLERSAQDTRRPGVTYDAVIVLGGAMEGSPYLVGVGSYNSNIDRLIVTHELLRSGQASLAILAGGRDEAFVMRDQLLAWGIAEDRLLLETESLNTRQNAVFAARIAREAGTKTHLLVTSAYHMLRAEECFRAVGLDVDTLPVDYRTTKSRSVFPRAVHLGETEGALREMWGRVVYRTVGYAVPADP